MAKIIIEFDFDADKEEYYTLKSIKAEPKGGMTENSMKGIAERWAQSDFYWVGITNAIISVLDGYEVMSEDIKYYI